MSKLSISTILPVITIFSLPAVVNLGKSLPFIICRILIGLSFASFMPFLNLPPIYYYLYMPLIAAVIDGFLHDEEKSQLFPKIFNLIWGSHHFFWWMSRMFAVFFMFTGVSILLSKKEFMVSKLEIIFNQWSERIYVLVCTLIIFVVMIIIRHISNEYTERYKKV